MKTTCFPVCVRENNVLLFGFVAEHVGPDPGGGRSRDGAKKAVHGESDPEYSVAVTSLAAVLSGRSLCDVS